MDDLVIYGSEIETEKERMERLLRRSDGKFAACDRWVVINDHVNIHRYIGENGIDGNQENPFTEDDVRLASNDRPTAENLFERMKDDTIKDTNKSAINSAKGYNTRYGGDSKNPRTIKFARKYCSWIGCIGEHLPVKVKMIALPEDKLADSCKSWGEYLMKSELKQEKRILKTKEEFDLYKY